MLHDLFMFNTNNMFSFNKKCNCTFNVNGYCKVNDETLEEKVIEHVESFGTYPKMEPSCHYYKTFRSIVKRINGTRLIRVSRSKDKDDGANFDRMMRVISR